MATGITALGTAQRAEPIDLRSLLQLTAIRKLADRGLSGEETEDIRRLARATVRSAASGDVHGYLQADIVFHLRLLDLLGDPLLSGTARLLLAPRPEGVLGCGQAGQDITLAARQHIELICLIADEMVSEAEDLLRLHLSSCPYRASQAPGGQRAHC
jgi:DNA-binding GntR family transcriptional regulator